jgi:hypothetical protein
MRISGLVILILFAIVLSCIEPYEINETSSGNMLVVEGLISGEVKHHQIFLSRATSMNDRRIVRETGATVSISDQNGNVISLTEASPGVYETPEVAAEAGNSYRLNIKTAGGREYASQDVPYKDGAEIGNVYGRYVDNPRGDGRGIQIYVDTQDPTNQTLYYRWNFIETYQVNAPFPSNWIWLGGNEVEFRHDGIDTCYVTDTLRSVLIKTTKDLEQDVVTAQPLRYIPDDSYIMRFRYSILVQQFALSKEAYLYWENLKRISEEQGSLADRQPGSLDGNIKALTNGDETVLGYFEACKATEKRIILKPIDFYNDGFKRPENFRNSCYQIEPLLVNVSQLGETMERYKEKMYIWEAYGDGPGTTFELMPKTCCDCRDQGPTEKPPFF